MGLLQLLFGGSNTSQINQFKSDGAIILDVRTSTEFKSGNYTTSINIPLDSISTDLEKIKSWKKPIILVCKSGVRASLATRQLKKAGIECINAGSWKNM